MGVCDLIFRRSEILLRNKRRNNDNYLYDSFNLSYCFSGTFGDWWTSGDARWILSGGYLYLNYTDWNSAVCVFKNVLLFPLYDYAVIEFTVRRESGSTAWDFESRVYNFPSSGNTTLVYFNGAATTAQFFGIAFSYQGVTGSDNNIRVIVENNIQRLYINDTLKSTLNNVINFPIYFYYVSAKNQVKMNNLRVSTGSIL